MKKLVSVLNTGLLPYNQGLKLQQSISAALKGTSTPEKGVLILTEHPSVYTVGIRAKIYQDEEFRNRLRELGAEFFETDRGGLITFHGLGQLVAYPVLNLKYFHPSVRWYVKSLEQTALDTVATFGISGNLSPDTGIWVENFKICAIGVRCSSFITTHGLALNCNIDLSWFEHIVPCGLLNKGVTSMSRELNRNVTVEEVIPTFLECFANNFSCIFQNVDFQKLDDLIT